MAAPRPRLLEEGHGIGDDAGHARAPRRFPKDARDDPHRLDLGRRADAGLFESFLPLDQGFDVDRGDRELAQHRPACFS